MPLIIICPSGHRLKVPKKRAGHHILCPVCNTRISVPALQPPQATPLPPSSPPAVCDADTVTQAASAKVPLLRPVESPDDGQITAPQVEARTAAVARSHESPASISRLAPPNDAVAHGAGEPLSESGENHAEHFEWDKVPLQVPEQEVPQADEPTLPLIRTELPSIGQRLTQQSFETRFKRDQQLGVWVLGIAAIVVAAFCSVPSIMDQVASRRAGLQSADTWTYIVLLAATIQVAVAIYAIRLPDWSTSWIASLIATGFAAMYALGLALTMFASQEHQIVKQLGLLDEAFHWRAQLWCFLVMCVTLILAYCYGRFSLRWYKLEKQLIESRA